MSRKCVLDGWCRWWGPLEGAALLGCLSLPEFAEPGWTPASFLILLPQVKPFLTLLLRKVTFHTWERLDVGLSVLNPRDGGRRLTGSLLCPAPTQASEGC